MAPSTLDLFILTFNCAKNLIDTSVFASHLHGALSQKATGLPDVVVFSLQEVAPLSYAFIGPYFLNPYYARFGEALNLASEQVLATSPDGDDEDAASVSQATGGSQGKTQPYTLVRANNVGMTAILLYVRDPDSIRKIEEAECGFGAADMGNKGAVGLRVTWRGRGQQEQDSDQATELTFVAAHLAAMEWNTEKRNANWRSIVSGLTFANPRSILPEDAFPARRAAPTPDRSGAGDIGPRLPTGDSPDPSEAEDQDQADPDPDDDDEESESESASAPTAPLLPTTPQDPDHDQPRLSPAHLAALHAISVYKPTAHLFVAGDLNYRISATSPPPDATFPSVDPASPSHHPAFLARDQLTRERRARRTLHGLREAAVCFGPTYKFDVLAEPAAEDDAAVSAGATENGVAVVPWRFARHRWPGWCDRVLFLDALGGGGKGCGGGMIETRVYEALPVMAVSDHRAVGVDPRVRLPVPVDVHAWERRAAARRKELVVGWTALVWSTPAGAALMGTALALGAGSWWFLRG
ncbi:DNase I-like protein [Trichocladium antarcticum]|uniref:DNase I-like protein n=1 Tax=Trichocladium antarcticum TaxID=1450529 RepID=A0AAN6UQF4_9PEZI|nr:DNase I-like protein [Trichocladium antarcticum]